ncbi:MAG: biotin--[acetyl-CoA-carboxylase] ligase [Novosphingobium sp.]|nr:biotin--[acetyl-CoA-carboxylase] ligase [Novosphingobium sp.]
METVAATGSTNADLAARLAGGEYVAEGHWLVAERQTAGRGRLGRSWFDGGGNFMGSTLVRLRHGDPDPASLALLAGLALHELVSPLVPPPSRVSLKWPNDLLVGPAKLAGILLERVRDAVVVGIGVNLAQAPELQDRATVALADLTAAPDREFFAAALARQFDLELERWRSFGLAPVLARWQAAAHPLGTALRIDEPGQGTFVGTYAGLDEGGALRLRLADGTTRVIHAGEVSLA